MIRYIKLNNYKSLVDFKVDFMKTKDTSKKLVLIYGENGIGKSNLANSFYTLNEIMRTMAANEFAKNLLDQFSKNENFNKESSKVAINFANSIIKANYKDTKMIIDEYKTIDSTDNMILEYGFTMNGQDGVYRIEFDNEKIVSERLDFTLNKNITNYFNINTDNMKINANIFKDKKYYNEFIELLNKYWSKHSFMSILSYEIDDKKIEYMKNAINENLYNVLLYLNGISTKINGKNNSEFGAIRMNSHILENLDNGKILIKDEDELNKTEYLLNEIFTSLYSDIKRVYYKKNYEDNYVKYHLYFKKMIYGKIKDINFSLESTGTQNILTIIPYLIAACEGQTVIIDELDTGIHDLLIKGLLECVVPYIKGQLIITTHNTILINSMPTGSIYIFRANKNAEKTLISLDDFQERIQKNNNPQKKYLSGLFGGVPIISDIDFEELIDNLK